MEQDREIQKDIFSINWKVLLPLVSPSIHKYEEKVREGNIGHTTNMYLCAICLTLYLQYFLWEEYGAEMAEPGSSTGVTLLSTYNKVTSVLL